MGGSGERSILYDGARDERVRPPANHQDGGMHDGCRSYSTPQRHHYRHLTRIDSKQPQLLTHRPYDRREFSEHLPPSHLDPPGIMATPADKTVEELEQEEIESFQKGPLSVLTTAVKTNSQVSDGVHLFPGKRLSIGSPLLRIPMISCHSIIICFDNVHKVIRYNLLSRK